MKPLKKFGQNYLIDKNISKKLVECLSIIKSDSVLEIGPGKGFITNEIAPLVDKFCAIEIDTRVIDELKQKFSNAEIIQSDIKKICFEDLEIKKPIKVVGNIPFNLTGDILFKLIEERKFVSEVSLIISLDIAKRLVAKKRTKEYGAITVIFDYLTTTKIVSKVSKNVFFPKPNVEAAIIHVKFDKSETPNIDSKLFMQIVKASFGNRRKTLNNSLRNSIFAKCDFSEISLPLSKRAEEFEVKDFLILTEYIQNQQCH